MGGRGDKGRLGFAHAPPRSRGYARALRFSLWGADRRLRRVFRFGERIARIVGVGRRIAFQGAPLEPSRSHGAASDPGDRVAFGASEISARTGRWSEATRASASSWT